MGVEALTSVSLQNLRESGLGDDIIELAGIKDRNSDDITAQVLRKVGAAEGYFIPYLSTKGEYTGHYRIRILSGEPGTPKYRQPAGSTNHIYLPPNLDPQWLTDVSQPIIITEGEKKALAAVQAGLICIGVGGVDSWRSRILKLTPDSIARTKTGHLLVKVSANHDVRLIDELIAPELLEIDWSGRRVVIVYDSDLALNGNVQRAAFELAIWLDEQGATVGTYYLPNGSSGQKVGLDDFLKDFDASELIDGLADPEVIFPFPVPPDVRAWIQKEMNDKPLRSRQRRVARGALAVLDSEGSRYRDRADNYYYFQADNKVLHPFRLDALQQLRQSSFGARLADRLGIQTADTSVVSRLADEFVATAPVSEVQPRRVVGTQSDVLYYQVSDGRLARVSASGFDIVDNGTDGMLFLPEVVTPVDEEELIRAIGKVKHPSRWLKALQTVNLQPIGELSIDQTQKLLATLFYLSPWLNRWRGLMLPLEVAVAEPNSGKTFLYNLRRGVLTGSPNLEGLQEDFKGWVSSISAAPAMWVCDNLTSAPPDFWRRMNDELARLITDPNPVVELRRLYTTASIARVPINCVFAVTTIKNPFSAPDILQRSLIYELHAIPVNQRNGNWYKAQLDDRIGWLAEHLVVIQEFFKRVQHNWDPDYKSGYRLVHFEQALKRMAEVLGWGDEMAEKIVPMLPGVVASAVAMYDSVIEGLVTFVTEYTQSTAAMSDIVDWAQSDPESRFTNIKAFQNSILLGRYFKAHEYDIQQSTGMEITRKHNTTVLVMPK